MLTAALGDAIDFDSSLLLLDSLTSPLAFANSVVNQFNGGSGDEVAYTVALPMR